MSAQSIDHVALLPAYLAAATAAAVLLADLFVGHRIAVLATAALGITATGVAAAWLGLADNRATFAVDGHYSYVLDGPGATVAVVLAGLTLAVLALSADTLRAPDGPPVGEYAFLLACSLTGGVVVAFGRDLITLIVAVETLTLPLYALVAMRRTDRTGAEAAVTFLVASVAAGATTLFGAALLYAQTGALHLSALSAALSGETTALTAAGVAMIVVGLSFKVAAVPLHAWAPGTYDGAPLPIAAYLSTASKLGGVAALLWILLYGLGPVLNVAGIVLAVLAVATMTVGNLAALRATRAVRLLAWSSVAQAGYLLAPLGAFVAVSGREDAADAATAVLGFAVFYVLLELTAFGALIGLRGGAGDGGAIADYAGSWRRSRWLVGAFVLALIGLAGLPPGLAGLFAKVTIVSWLAGPATWLAVVVAVNAVIGLVYYLRFARVLIGASASPRTDPVSVRWPVAVTVALATIAMITVGFLPQFVLDIALFT